MHRPLHRIVPTRHNDSRFGFYQRRLLGQPRRVNVRVVRLFGVVSEFVCLSCMGYHSDLICRLTLLSSCVHSFFVFREIGIFRIIGNMFSFSPCSTCPHCRRDLRLLWDITPNGSSTRSSESKEDTLLLLRNTTSTKVALPCLSSHGQAQTTRPPDSYEECSIGHGHWNQDITSHGRVSGFLYTKGGKECYAPAPRVPKRGNVSETFV